ncbi:hypothetical protein T02_14271 [Trichinella nativa]|uniref:Uncharacterized protein n=1 Tax=Trichinella nativa TaxID=6335 RepID=A0A0V1LJF8_9BILA|nr:hypothetical protein T02_14271 [Trichinella nativa]
MSEIIKAIPHIADETANTKKQTDVNCELIENQLRNWQLLIMKDLAADTVVFVVVVVVEVFCSTQIITKAINKRIRYN